MKKSSTFKDDKGIEIRYHSLMNQLSFARFYLTQLGCMVKKEDYNVEHKSIEFTSRGNVTFYKNCFVDDLYHGFEDFQGLISDNNRIFKDSSTCHETLSCLVKGMIGLLKKKLVLSQYWLVLCWEYCKQFDMAQLFVDTLKDVIQDCLGSDSLTASKSDATSFVIRFGALGFLN